MSLSTDSEFNQSDLCSESNDSNTCRIFILQSIYTFPCKNRCHLILACKALVFLPCRLQWDRICITGNCCIKWYSSNFWHWNLHSQFFVRNCWSELYELLFSSFLNCLKSGSGKFEEEVVVEIAHGWTHFRCTRCPRMMARHAMRNFSMMIHAVLTIYHC